MKAKSITIKFSIILLLFTTCKEKSITPFAISPSKLLYVKISTKSGLNLRKDPSDTSQKIKILKDGDIGVFLGYKGDLTEVSGIKGFWYNVEFNNSKGYIFSPYVILSYNKEILKDLDYGDSNFGTIIPLLRLVPSYKINQDLKYNDIWFENKPIERSINPIYKKIDLFETFQIEVFKEIEEDYSYYNVLFKNPDGNLKFTSNHTNLEPIKFSTKFPLLIGGITQCHNCDATTLYELYILKNNKILIIPHWSESENEECLYSDDIITETELRVSNSFNELHIKDTRFECIEIDEPNCEAYETCKNNPPIYFEKVHKKSYYIKITNHHHDLIIDGEFSKGKNKELNFEKYFKDTIPLELTKFSI
ncbi:hypothetical protein LPTSP2_38860 [Leptospira ellinghausenii]|uniref:SH3b domain-containing protein n=1 Tax=Leptospira ellinghausenii TaxID=1917822 RepID=A0A2P2DIU5_9LEPT|nr:SH3 domain-containing protein [Leptospira ellinghausenii]GBF44583.1 hypothetical protein LPTSP2_38860 [Leptospira ellinghausenii]